MHLLEKLTSYNIVWHENRGVYISVRKKGKEVSLRLHRLFFDAPTPVLEAIVRFVTSRDPAARTVIRQMAHLHFSNAQNRPAPLESKGEVYDLQEIFDRLNVSMGLQGVTIGWARRASRSRFRSMIFGSFDQSCRQIRMNPRLDDSLVPLYFIEYIVYHEMLHAVFPTEMNGRGRCAIHTGPFRDKERQFPQFELAKKWEKNSLQFFKKRSYGRS